MSANSAVAPVNTHGFQYLNGLDLEDIDRECLNMLRCEVATHLRAIVINKDDEKGEIEVVVDDPTNPMTMDTLLQLLPGYKITLCVTSELEMTEALQRYYIDCTSAQ